MLYNALVIMDCVDCAVVESVLNRELKSKQFHDSVNLSAAETVDAEPHQFCEVPVNEDWAPHHALLYIYNT
jgi:hypothetical protein